MQTTIMENQMEKKMENEMETRIILGSYLGHCFTYCRGSAVVRQHLGNFTKTGLTMLGTSLTSNFRTVSLPTC